jgi:MoxR-like ATPase
MEERISMTLNNNLPQRIVESISKVVIGKRAQIENVVVCLLAGGHVLIEDIPGVGKTLLSLATANAISAGFKRVQFTSDTLPSDVLGVNIYDPGAKEFVFKPGPVFTEVLLADEINRTSPRTQSALLEAMAEGKVSIDGATHDLKGPFLVLATMNPSERFGAFELPESQLDRFMMTITLGYPDKGHEKQILEQDMEHSKAVQAPSVTDPQTALKLQKAVREVSVEDSVMEYILNLVRATRESKDIRLGVSSRGGLHLKRASQARAILEGRDYVTPADVRTVFLPVTIHRIQVALTAQDGHARAAKASALNWALSSTPAPV